MTYRLLACLDTETGTLRRYRRGPAGKAEKLGEDFFRHWADIRLHAEEQVYELIQAFRAAWEPPEDPSPTGAGPQRMSRAA